MQTNISTATELGVFVLANRFSKHSALLHSAYITHLQTTRGQCAHTHTHTHTYTCTHFIEVLSSSYFLGSEENFVHPGHVDSRLRLSEFQRHAFVLTVLHAPPLNTVTQTSALFICKITTCNCICSRWRC
jgi:hypothetical protein